MVKTILAAAGIRERGSRFTKPPAETYAVWFDDIETDGPDGMPPRIFTHNVSVELYERKPDNEAVAALEAELTAALDEAGFDLCGIYSDFDFSPVTETTERWYVVARTRKRGDWYLCADVR